MFVWKSIILGRYDRIKKILSLFIILIFLLSGSIAVGKNSENITGLNEPLFFDDIPPYVNITSPKVGVFYLNIFDKQFQIPFNPPILTFIIGKIDVEVDATDDSGIAWVKFYIDNEFKAVVNETPYVWSWDEECLFFSYVVKVVACDCAGNENSTQIRLWKMQIFF